MSDRTEPNRTESFLKNFEPNRFRFGRFGSVRFETEPVPSLVETIDWIKEYMTAVKHIRNFSYFKNLFRVFSE